MTAAISTPWNWQLPVLLAGFNESVIWSLGIEHLQEIHGLSRSKFPSDTAFLLALGRIFSPFSDMICVCDIFIPDIYPPNDLCTSCRCSGNSAFFWEIHPDTRAVLFWVSAHPCDMCFIFASASHIYSGHLPTILFVYILQMFQKFRIFLHTMVVFPRFSAFFPRTIIWTPGLFFFRFSAHPWDIYMCISYLFKTFTHQIICAHLSNALDILPFSQDIYPDTRVVFFRCSTHTWDM